MLSNRYSSKHLHLIESSGQPDGRSWKEAFSVGFSLSCVDVAAVTIAGLLSIWFFSGVFPTSEHGFYCDDVSIGKPYSPNVTVTTERLLLITVGAPLLLIHILEFANLFLLPNLMDNAVPAKITYFFYNSTPLILKYVSGFCFMCSTFELLKALFGELRPYFLDVCKPDWSKTPCADNSHIRGLYAPDAYCTASAKAVRQSRRSFPSGHASAAFFATTYLIVYYRNVFFELDKYVKTHRRGNCIIALKRFVQIFILAFFMWACFCSYSRISDFWHHPRDIFWGIIMGVCMSFIFYKDK